MIVVEAQVLFIWDQPAIQVHAPEPTIRLGVDREGTHRLNAAGWLHASGYMASHDELALAGTSVFGAPIQGYQANPCYRIPSVVRLYRALV